jgi:stage II sporulation protein D
MIVTPQRLFFRILGAAVAILLFPPALPVRAEEMTVTVRILEKHLDGRFTLSSADGLEITIGSMALSSFDPVTITPTETGPILTLDENTTLDTSEGTVITSRNPDGFVTITIEKTALTRSYRGDIIVSGDDTGPVVVNRVSLSDYLASVVAGEMGGNEEAALMAQAIISRTWVMTHLGSHDGADLCDLTHCQSYTGVDAETPAATRATKKTEGLIVTYGGEPAMIFYHACAGGVTTSPKYVWNGPDIPYLVPVPEILRGRDLSAGSPHRSWEWRVERDELFGMLLSSFGGTYRSISISERDPSGRAMTMLLTGEESRTITGEELRIAVGREFGWGCLKSTLFDLTLSGNEYVFSGKGLGHGVGLGQWGAMELARSGLTAEEIVLFYFPNTVILPLSDLNDAIPD